MLLKLHNVYAGYEGGDVLKGIDLQVEQGTTTCIVGPNGAGKSTVLRVLSGLLRPRLGEITFDAHSLVGLSPRQILALGIVQVPQSHSLFPTMTVQENVRLGAYMLSDAGLVERRLHEVEEMFPIVKTRARDKAGNLSGGQQRLVEFARCLMLDPRLILLDEPSMGLSPILVQTVFDTIIRVREEGVTIFLVEQNASKALSVADRGYVLQTGKIVLSDTAKNLLTNDLVRQAYLGGA